MNVAPDPDTENLVRHVHKYVLTCVDVVESMNNVLEMANDIVRAREMANLRPQHEISIKNFEKMAEELEPKFVPPYKRFVELCKTAREAASALKAVPTALDPELVLVQVLNDELYGKVSMAGHILRTNFGPTPLGFIEGIHNFNAAIDGDIFGYGEDGFIECIYSPPQTAESNLRTCPWCTETIKSAAIICRFCGRDV